MQESPTTYLDMDAHRGVWVWVPESQSGMRLLGELMAEIRAARRWFLVAALSAGLVAAAVSLVMPTRYHSIAVLVPVDTSANNAFSGISGSLAGLAGLTGLSLPGTQGAESAVALATVKSRGFLVEFARRHGIVMSIFAHRYDEDEGIWRSTVFTFGKGEPTDEEIYEEMADLISVEHDELTQIVTLTVAAPDAYRARSWSSALIHDLNERIRLRDVREAERAIEYLNRQIEATSVAELRQVFYRLIEERTKTVMLANVSTEYALRVIDPPSMSDRPAEPRQFLLVALGVGLGAFALFVWILARFTLRPYVTPDAALEQV